MTQCRQAGVKVVPLPGACAVITALSASGLPSDRFSFEGFLPRKAKAVKINLWKLQKVERTCIFMNLRIVLRNRCKDMLSVLGPEREVVWRVS